MAFADVGRPNLRRLVRPLTGIVQLPCHSLAQRATAETTGEVTMDVAVDVTMYAAQKVVVLLITEHAKGDHWRQAHADGGQT